MPGIKELKTRIKSIGSTRKITRAMQMVSAAKMKRAQNLALGNRSYAERAWELIQNIANLGSYTHPLIKIFSRAPKVGIVFISSNRGLVGSLNINLISELRKLEKQTGPLEAICELITYGRKGNQMLSRLGRKIVADFPKLDKNASVEEIYPIAQMVGEMYQTGQYSKIFIVYNHFQSTLSQKPVIKQILPFKESIRQDLLNEDDQSKADDPGYIFEPTPNEVLEHLLPRILESQLLEAILESDASEHSARMVMMKNATEAAGDLISDLTLTFNQLRQNKITTELAEITAGKIALE